ncbi:hypothetical protein [Streptomyces sp. NPDC058394]|uniref:hypothetical protein n=1 Tax=Streptomyces sp. NPDC058394 TaxID=3346477 RepID=UPI00365AE676
MSLADRDLRAVAKLTTQVKRIADALSTPVTAPVVEDETTPVDLRQQIADALEAADYRKDMRRGDLADSIMPIVQAVAADRDRLAAELARIRRALDPDDETYIRETVDDQLRLQTKVQELLRDNKQLRGEQAACITAELQRNRLAATLREVLDHFTEKGHPGELCLRTGWLREDTVAQWRAALGTNKEH